MTFRYITGASFFAAPVAFAPIAFTIASPALADTVDSGEESSTISAVDDRSAETGAVLDSAQSQSEARGQSGARGSTVANGPPTGDTVFDETWLTVGVGAGYVPSYSGSDDYVVFPLPLIAGRVGGVGVRPSAAGVTLDLLSPGLSPAAVDDVQFSLGPTFRFRNDRVNQIEDPVVEAAGELDTAVEVGLSGGVSFPGVLNPFDRVTVSAAVRHDILGAHDGLVIEPGVSYFTPLSRAAIVTVSAGVQFVDDDFADYYYSVSPGQSAASGLPEFAAEGGLNNYGVNVIGAYDLDGNALNGGLSLFGIGSYSRLVNDGADTPYTAIRGDADQWLAGVGIAYTF